MRSASASTARVEHGRAERELDALVARGGAMLLERRVERARATAIGARVQLDAPGLDARQVEQIVDDALQPLAVFARGVEQVGLLRRERADGLLETQVDGHAQRGERRAELVRDGGHEIVLELVEAAQARHVLHDDRQPGHLAPTRRGPGWRAAGESACPCARGDAERLLEPLGHVAAASGAHVLEEPLHRRRAAAAPARRRRRSALRR